MSSAAHGKESGRVEHALFGCPGDLGFRLVDKSASLSGEERAALMGLSDQKSGPMLQSEAVTVADLGQRFAILVTRPDSTPGTRKGLVVTHAFLIAGQDYASVGYDPFTVLGPVREGCRRPGLPKRADLARDLVLQPEPRGRRLAALPLDDRLVAEVAPVVTDALFGSQEPMVVPSDTAMLAVELAIGLMPIARRRSLTFATADFSRDASRLSLVGLLEPVQYRSARKTVVKEIEWLLTQSPEVATSIAERLADRWPEGAAERDLVKWLRARRELYELEQSDDFKRMVEVAGSIVQSWDGVEEELIAAGRLVGRALTLEGTFQTKVRARVVDLLNAAMDNRLIERLLAAADDVLRHVGPIHALCGRAMLAEWSRPTGALADVSTVFHRDLEECLEQEDPRVGEQLVRVMNSNPPLLLEHLSAIEWFGWWIANDGLRQLASSKLDQSGADDAELAGMRRRLLLRILAEGEAHWIDLWFDDHASLVARTANVNLDLIMAEASPGQRRERAVARTLESLTSAHLESESRVSQWLLATGDQCAEMIFRRIARTAQPADEAAPALNLIRGLLAGSSAARTDASVQQAMRLFDLWRSRRPVEPGVLAASSKPVAMHAYGDRADGREFDEHAEHREYDEGDEAAREGRSWLAWLWPFSRSSKIREPAVKARTQGSRDQSPSNLSMWILLVLLISAAVAVVALGRFGGNSSL